MHARILGIEARTVLLRSQRDSTNLITSLPQVHAPTNNDKALRKWTNEQAHLEVVNNDLLAYLQSQLAASERQADICISGVTAGIDRLLETDDKVVDSLHNLRSRSFVNDDMENISAETDIFCNNLIRSISKQIMQRVDAAYESGLVFSEHSAFNIRPGSPTVSQKNQADSLRIELGELSGEIDGLATMAVESRFRGPIVQQLNLTNFEQRGTEMRWALYIHSVLAYHVKRLHVLANHLQQLQHHKIAIQHLSAALQSVSRAFSTLAHHSDDSHHKLPSITHKKGLKPLRLVQENFSDHQDPAIGLLRQLDPSQMITDTTNLSEEKLEHLYRSLLARDPDKVSGSETGDSTQVSQSVLFAYSDIEHLTRSLHAFTPFLEIHLTSYRRRKSLTQLRTQTGDVKTQMQASDIY